MADRMSAATKRLIFMLGYRDGVGSVAGDRDCSVVCTVRGPLGKWLDHYGGGGAAAGFPAPVKARGQLIVPTSFNRLSSGTSL